MTELTWLHLSDWHQAGDDFDRTVVRDALIKDIRRRTDIASSLARIDLVIFSGDVASRGELLEYERARKELFDPILENVSLTPDRLFLVPGNHDLNRETVKTMLPPQLQKPITSNTMIHEWLTDERKRARVLEPFDDYVRFVSAYTGQLQPAYASIRRLVTGDSKIALLGLNSAWMCARNRNEENRVVDYGYALVGEPQIHDALTQITESDLRVVVLHHPFEWLATVDRSRIRNQLRRECHIILHGHDHNPEVNVEGGTGGDCIIIPAGASYDRRIPEIGKCANAYNFVHLDLQTRKGMVYLRRWSDQRNSWIEDEETHPSGRVPLRLPKNSGTTARAHLRQQVDVVESVWRDFLDNPLEVVYATGKRRGEQITTVTDNSELQAMVELFRFFIGRRASGTDLTFRPHLFPATIGEPMNEIFVGGPSRNTGVRRALNKLAIVKFEVKTETAYGRKLPRSHLVFDGRRYPVEYGAGIEEDGRLVGRFVAKDYGVAAKLRTEKGWTMILAGCRAYGTHAAALAVTREDVLAEILGSLRPRAGELERDLAVLISAEVENGVLKMPNVIKAKTL